jgi:hypothetical protein
MMSMNQMTSQKKLAVGSGSGLAGFYPRME